MIELEEEKQNQIKEDIADNNDNAEGLINIRTEANYGQSDGKEDVKHEKKVPVKGSGDKVFIAAVVFILLLIGVMFSVRYFIKPVPQTLDELNEENIEGNLEPEEGYLYNRVYSFVKTGGLWFFQLKSPSGEAEYNIPLHFGPRELEDIVPEGGTGPLFTNTTDIYVTFNPLDPDLQYTALAVSELDQNIITSFGKKPIAACDRNETEACFDRPIVTCDNINATPVIYIRYNETTRLILQDDCIVIQGKGIEQVRLVDRLLLQWYGVME